MNNKKFFAGLEEIVARLIALIFSLLGFIIYMVSRDSLLPISWPDGTILLLIFWLSYEFLGYIFYLILSFFSSRTPINLDPNLSKSISEQELENSNESDEELEKDNLLQSTSESDKK